MPVVERLKPFGNVIDVLLIYGETMRLRWKKPGIADNILKRIAAQRIPSIDGKSNGFKNRVLEFDQPILESVIIFPNYVLRNDRYKIVFHGLCNAEGELNAESFLNSASKELAKYSAIPYRDFFVLTSISISPTQFPEHFQWDGCDFQVFSSEYPSQFSSREDLVQERYPRLEESPRTYAKLAIRVREKDANRAINSAFRRLDTLRSIWNILYGFTGGSSSEQRPLNRIRLGRIHSVHQDSGEPAENYNLWYETGYFDASIFKADKPEKFWPLTLNWLKHLDEKPYRSKIVDALLLSVKALDESEPNVAFAKLWTALEVLVNDKNAENDVLIKRCSFVFDEHEHAKEVLEYLRDFRNAYVHSGEESSYARRETFLLLRYFNAMIRFYIGESELTSLENVNEFLDLPNDMAILQRKKNLYDRAIAFRASASRA